VAFAISARIRDLVTIGWTCGRTAALAIRVTRLPTFQIDDHRTPPNAITAIEHHDDDGNPTCLLFCRHSEKENESIRAVQVRGCGIGKAGGA
jgi:hypothetical protein